MLRIPFNCVRSRGIIAAKAHVDYISIHLQLLGITGFVKKDRHYLFPLFSLLLFSLVVFGCTPDGASDSTLENLEFNVTDSLLARPVTEPALGITYRPPRGWVRVEQSLIDSAQKLAAERTNLTGNGGAVLGAYGDSATQSIFLIRKIDSFDVSDSSVTVRQYVQQLKSVDPSLDIKTAVFRVGDHRVHQIVALSATSVSLRMMFDNLQRRAPMFELNFASPKEFYATKAKEIESVVGSLQPVSSIQ